MINLSNNAFFQTPKKEINDKQEKLDKILSKLTKEEINDLDDILSWVSCEARQEQEFEMNDC